MNEGFNENLNQNINIPKGGDGAVKDLLEEVRERIEREGLWAADKLFETREVTEENREEFNKIWKKVWEQEGYHEEGESIEDRENYYNQYLKNSKDIILYVKNKKGKELPIGTMRLVKDEKRGLPAFTDPTFKDQADKKWKEKKCVEFTLLTVLPEWRKLQHLTSFVLWREGYRYMKETKSEQIIIITDEKLVGLFQKVGFPLHEIAEPTKYEGGICGVYTISIDEVEIQFRKINPEAFEWFTQGIDVKKIKQPEEK